MPRLRRHPVAQTLLAGLVALSLSTTAAAQTSAPATGLGQAWPNAADVSRSPDWHVYVFERDGVRYIQINDRHGTVHAVLGRAGDTTFTLPQGVEADSVTMASSTQSSVSAPLIYQDETISVTAAPQSDGTAQIMVQAACDASNCIGGRAMAQ